jgi:hypothetical protein
LVHLVDVVQELLRLGHAEGDVRGGEVLHVVAALHVLHHMTATRGPKGLKNEHTHVHTGKAKAR